MIGTGFDGDPAVLEGLPVLPCLPVFYSPINKSDFDFQVGSASPSIWLPARALASLVVQVGALLKLRRNFECRLLVTKVKYGVLELDIVSS
jgi:hypothetical protein